MKTGKLSKLNLLAILMAFTLVGAACEGSAKPAGVSLPDRGSAASSPAITSNGADQNGANGAASATANSVHGLGVFDSAIGTVTPEPTEAAEPTEVPEHEIEFAGTVSAINGDVWTIDGRSVTVNANTQLQGSINVGSFVKVKALIVADGSLVARRIELKLTDGNQNGNSNSNENENENQNDNSNSNSNSNENESENENHNGNSNLNDNSNSNENENHNENQNGNSNSNSNSNSNNENENHNGDHNGNQNSNDNSNGNDG